MFLPFPTGVRYYVPKNCCGVHDPYYPSELEGHTSNEHFDQIIDFINPLTVICPLCTSWNRYEITMFVFRWITFAVTSTVTISHSGPMSQPSYLCEMIILQFLRIVEWWVSLTVIMILLLMEVTLVWQFTIKIQIFLGNYDQGIFAKFSIFDYP